MRIKNLEQNTLTLDNFQGPLAFLHYLVERAEIDIREISLQKITEQYLHYLIENEMDNLDAGAEFIDHTGALLWLKSKTLLPPNPNDEETESYFKNSPLEILPHLIDYCRFKQAAKELGLREDGQGAYFVRGMIPTEDDFPKPMGIERISLDELQELFSQMVAKAVTREPKIIREEPFRVADKIQLLRGIIREKEQFTFHQAMSDTPCKEEVIVTFLGILELLKLGELALHREENQIWLKRTLT